MYLHNDILQQMTLGLELIPDKTVCIDVLVVLPHYLSNVQCQMENWQGSQIQLITSLIIKPSGCGGQ